MATTETYTPSQLYSVPLAELQADPKVLIGLAKNKQQGCMILLLST
ncbi:MAG: hypothetical protein M0P16_09075 [Syntrophales bacterium]|jgi:hypothetical protein|nr:hypothetical protein [Syntrophales bacterium]MCK9391263.1 hypothetical protein [Syntrophales bacterium]